MMKKYEFTGETKQAGVFGEITLKRIRAVVAFGIVEIGELGGWIQEEKNLSHEGNAWVYGNAEVYGDAEVYGNAWVCGNAEVCKVEHLLVIGKIGSRHGFTTFFRDKENQISVRCGCFLGKLDAFLEKVAGTHGDSKHALVYRASVEVAKLQIELDKE